MCYYAIMCATSSWRCYLPVSKSTKLLDYTIYYAVCPFNFYCVTVLAQWHISDFLSTVFGCPLSASASRSGTLLETELSAVRAAGCENLRQTPPTDLQQSDRFMHIRLSTQHTSRPSSIRVPPPTASPLLSPSLQHRLVYLYLAELLYCDTSFPLLLS